MSYELGVWAAPVPQDDAEAGRLFVAAIEEGPGRERFRPSPAVAAFIADLAEQWPDFDTLAYDEIEDSPWVGPFEGGAAYRILSMSGSWASEVVPEVVRLAERHQLVVFDPQEDRVIARPRATGPS